MTRRNDGLKRQGEQMTETTPHNRNKNYRIRKESEFLKILGVSNDAREIKPNMYSKKKKIEFNK